MDVNQEAAHIFAAWPGFSNNEDNCGGNQTAGYSSGESVALTCQNAASAKSCLMNKMVFVIWCALPSFRKQE